MEEQKEKDKRLIYAIQLIFGPDPNVVEPLTPEKREELMKKADAALKTLMPREEKVLRLRFGFTEPGHSTDEVAQDFFVTRERIRQIEAKALKKLRHPTRVSRLKTFLD
ncbi:MAG: sigma factor-like helix-turn-helix DNA-binding protein [Patescibacteria group bacterium]